MSDAAHQIFDSLEAYGDLEELIDRGEAEGLYIECKAPSEPRLNRELKATFAKAVSGFSNTTGGILIWGISTTPHAHSRQDILTQLEPIGHARRFARQIEAEAAALTTPGVTTSITKVIPDSPGSTRGVIVTLIPQSMGDPIQSTIDQHFYFRNGDEFTVLPYEMLRRLFAASDTPDLVPSFSSGLVKLSETGAWHLPIIVENQSSAVGEHVKISVTIENPENCDSVVPGAPLRDVSGVNPDKTIFISHLAGVVHRGMSELVGWLGVEMKGRRRSLDISINIFANRMRAKHWRFLVNLSRSGFAVRMTKEGYLY